MRRPLLRGTSGRLAPRFLYVYRTFDYKLLTWESVDANVSISCALIKDIMSAEKTLSIIIPAYNEEKTICQILDKIKQVELINGIKKQVIVVNDSSTDQTEELVLLYKEKNNNILDIQYIKHSQNRGKGYAIRTGIKLVTGDFVIIQDADLEYDPEDYNLLLPTLLKGEKVVYGSRFLMKENKHSYQTFYLGGLLVTTVTNILYRQHLTDEPTCYKAFQTAFLKSIPLECTGFEFCPEITAKTAQRGITIKEIPIHYYPRSVEEGKKIKWTDGIEAIYVLIKYFCLETLKRVKATSKELSITYLFLLLFCFASIVSVYLLPRTNTMQDNLKDSLQTVLNEGIYKRAFINMMLFDLDNPTNQTMLSKAAYWDKENLLDAALMNYGASGEEILSKEYTSVGTNMYGRYWHGYLVGLKPILMLTDYDGIRIINYVILTLLLIGVITLLEKKLNWKVAIMFLLSMLAVECYIVPLSLQLATMFYISLSSMLMLLLCNNLINRKRHIYNFFFIVGGLTAYFDFLTTPMMSLGLPLIVYILLNDKGNDWRLIIKISICWGIGYAAIWASKWVLVSVCTDYNMIADAIDQIFLRIGVVSDTTEQSGNVLLERITLTLSNMSSNPITLFLTLILGGCCIFFYKLPKVDKALQKNIAFIVIAIIPLIWYIVLGNHTGIHWRFTHRSLVVTFFATCIYIVNTIDWKRLLKQE